MITANITLLKQVKKVISFKQMEETKKVERSFFVCLLSNKFQREEKYMFCSLNNCYRQRLQY